MQDQDKTKDQLIDELNEMRRRIAELETVQKSLNEEKSRYRQVADEASDAIFIVQDGRIKFVNKAFTELTGYSEDSGLASQAIEAFVHPDDWDLVKQYHMRRLQGDNTLFRYDFRFIYIDGTVKWTEMNSSLIIWEGKPAALCLVTDFTERKQMEVVLRESEQRLELALEGGAIGLWDWNLKTGRAVLGEWATRMRRNVGYEQPPNIRNWKRAVHPDDWEKVSEVLNGHLSGRLPFYEVEYRMRTKSGEWKWFRSRGKVVEYDKEGKPQRMVGTTLDVSERRKAEEESDRLKALLFQSQKLEALGTLVGGIAHDFNNMLQVILGYSQLLLEDKKEGDLGYKDLQTIIQAGKGGADLVNKLLAFGQQSPIFPVDLDINYQIRGLIPLIFRTLPEIVKIDVDLTQEPTTIFADPNQIDQVVMNLAINASEAMPNGGQVKLATTTVTLNDEYCRSHSGVKPGKYVMLSLSDTGRGMDKEMLAKIFEPFFSTKQRGSTRGTGLGLSVVQGIVEKQGGHVTCESEPGKGSEFRIYFPAIESGSTTQEKTSSSAQSAGTETILVVEDTPSVAELERQILENAGYTVITANNGHEALEIYQTRRGEISLVILDLIMLEMSGKDCLMELVKIDPSVKVLIASGFSPSDELHKEINPLVKGFVHKPFGLIQLLDEVVSALQDK
jgi:PAS domain S-box-containing protein